MHHECSDQLWVPSDWPLAMAIRTVAPQSQGVFGGAFDRLLTLEERKSFGRTGQISFIQYSVRLIGRTVSY